MSSEIELSIMAPGAPLMQWLLEEFQHQTGIRVRLRVLSWDSAWSDIVKVALYGDGPDVSEIGSTWLGDLVSMKALRAFEESDLDQPGRPSAFLLAAWQGTHLVGQESVWAIPWLIGSRLLFYRRSHLAQAEIDEQTAFETAEALDQTLARLVANGVAVPWTVPTGLTHTTFLNVASWVWGAGGDFVTADGKRTLFSQPEARQGLSAYFALHRFLAPQVRQLNGLEPDEQFLKDNDTGVTISGAWLFGQASQNLLNELGAALPPGPPFIGGSYLVLWKHSRAPDAARKLIHFLTRTPAQVAYSQHVGLLPVTHDALASPPFSTDPFWQTAIRGLQRGRAFPVTRSWGLMEDRLVTALAAIWREVLADPSLDLDAAIARQLDPLAQRLDLVLGQT